MNEKFTDYYHYLFFPFNIVPIFIMFLEMVEENEQIQICSHTSSMRCSFCNESLSIVLKALMSKL